LRFVNRLRTARVLKFGFVGRYRHIVNMERVRVVCAHLDLSIRLCWGGGGDRDVLKGNYSSEIMKLYTLHPPNMFR